MGTELKLKEFWAEKEVDGCGICAFVENGFLWLLVVHVAREFLAQSKIAEVVVGIVDFLFVI